MPTFIENEDAYQRAINARIKAAIVAKHGPIWKATHADHAVINEWLQANYDRSEFAKSLFHSLCDYGKLSDKQTQAVRECIAQDEARKAARKAVDSVSQHVGTIDSRHRFDALTVTFITSYSTAYGVTYITGFKDNAGNIIIAKGKSLNLDKGDTVSLIARIVEHGMREGICQTRINRVTLLPR